MIHAVSSFISVAELLSLSMMTLFVVYLWRVCQVALFKHTERKQGMKKPRRINTFVKKKTGWSLHHLDHKEETFIQIDVAPLIAGMTDCLHVFYPQLQKSFTVSMDHLTES